MLLKQFVFFLFTKLDMLRTRTDYNHMDRCAICGAVTVAIKKSFLFEMTAVILGVLSSRLSLNVINIVVVADS